MLELAILRARVDVDYPRIAIVDHFIFICVLPRMHLGVGFDVHHGWEQALPLSDK